MATITETRITSAEIGVLWMSYQVKTLLQQMMGFFAQKSMDQEAKDIITNYVTNKRTRGHPTGLYKQGCFQRRPEPFR